MPRLNTLSNPTGKPRAARKRHQMRDDRLGPDLHLYMCGPGPSDCAPQFPVNLARRPLRHRNRVRCGGNLWQPPEIFDSGRPVKCGARLVGEREQARQFSSWRSESGKKIGQMAQFGRLSHSAEQKRIEVAAQRAMVLWSLQNRRCNQPRSRTPVCPLNAS